MSRATTAFLALILITACGGDTGGASDIGDTGDAATDAEGTRARTRPDAVVTGEIPVVEAVEHQIFDETREAEAPPRVTFHVLVPRDASRDELRATLSDVLTSETEADSTLVAVRVIGYRSEQTGANEAEMVPFVWAEWLPTEGWYEATEASRASLHRVYFYHDIAPQW